MNVIVYCSFVRRINSFVFYVRFAIRIEPIYIVAIVVVIVIAVILVSRIIVIRFVSIKRVVIAVVVVVVRFFVKVCFSSAACWR
jgi:hypothetical protein